MTAHEFADFCINDKTGVKIYEILLELKLYFPEIYAHLTKKLGDKK